MLLSLLRKLGMGILIAHDLMMNDATKSDLSTHIPFEQIGHIPVSGAKLGEMMERQKGSYGSQMPFQSSFR